MASEEEELALISDYVVAILKSPTWVSPISKFVDDNCGIFEDLEENKLEYTLVHNAFKQLVDDLLVAHLCEMQINVDQFMRFCQRGLSGSNELHRSLIEQLVSVEDFLVFKAMMVKRSCEINREVLGPALTNAAPSSSDQPSEEQLRDEAAEEAERLEAERRCVEAELQLAEALSLQLEKRLQLMEALDEVLELVSKIYKLRADAIEQEVAQAKLQEQELMQQAAAENMLLPAAAPALPAPAQLAPVQHSAHLPPVINPSVSIRPLSEANLYANRAGAFLDQPGAATLQAKKVEADMQKQRAEIASEAKRQEQQMMGVAAPSPPYDASGTPMYGMQQPGATSASGASLQPSAEEKAARAEHLKRQRELLIQKKNAERESQLAAFQMQNGATGAAQVAQRAIQQQPGQQATDSDAGKRLAAELSALAGGAPTPLPDPSAAAVEMRRMLTKQLKNSFC